MEHTEEEKKAIEYLKENSLVRLNKNNKIIAYGNSYKYYILNLLEKQQKEIERLAKTIDENIFIEPDEIGCHEELNIHIKDFIPKDVIRNKIKEFEIQKISIKVVFEKNFWNKNG